MPPTYDNKLIKARPIAKETNARQTLAAMACTAMTIRDRGGQSGRASGSPSKCLKWENKYRCPQENKFGTPARSERMK